VKKKSAIKLIFIVIFISAIIFIFRYFNLHEHLTLQKLHNLVDSFGIFGPLAFVLLYAVASTFGLPGTIFTIAGGIIFGKWLGTALNITGATLGACAAFAIGRFAARDVMAQKFRGQKWFDKLEKGIAEDGLNYMLFVRLVPVFPYNGLNYGASLTGISFKNYLIGTFFGMMPASFIFTNAAAEIGESIEEGFTLTAGMITSLVLLGILALVPIAVKKYKVYKKNLPD